MVLLKTKKDIEQIGKAGKIVAEVLRLVGASVKAGVKLRDLDAMAEDFIRSQGAEPAFKGYQANVGTPFPGTLCTSVNDEVVHGLPDDRILQEGDIVSIDVGTKWNGYFGDGAETFAVGEVGPVKKKLIQVTRESLAKGIEQARAGNMVHDISHAIQSHVEAHGFSCVRDLVGHGVGIRLHEEPAVPNIGKSGTGMKLKNGMTLAIEPMVNAGDWRVYTKADRWTVAAKDGSPSAHFEHTVAIMNGTPHILTQ